MDKRKLNKVFEKVRIQSDFFILKKIKNYHKVVNLLDGVSVKHRIFMLVNQLSPLTTEIV